MFIGVYVYSIAGVQYYRSAAVSVCGYDTGGDIPLGYRQWQVLVSGCRSFNRGIEGLAAANTGLAEVYVVVDGEIIAKADGEYRTGGDNDHEEERNQCNR